MFLRQKILLHLLHRSGGGLEKLRLMKLAFLARQKGHLQAATAVYGFVPYQFGPFSFALYRDLEKLTEMGFLAPDTDKVMVRSRGEPPPLDRVSGAGIDALWDAYGAWSTERIVNHVYAEYPWFTVNAKKEEKRRAQRPETEPAVFTVGYERLAFDDFLNRLLRCGIRHVIDVRANPVARRYGFHRSTLQRNLGKLDIAYTHLPELGIPGEDRANLSTAEDYAGLFAHYERDILPRQRIAVASVAKAMTAGATALLCMEADPEQCHRSRLGRAVATSTGMTQRDLQDVDAA